MSICQHGATERKCEICQMEQERDGLKAELSDIKAAYDKSINSPCPDEHHCTCVPALRQEVERLKAELAKEIERRDRAELALADAALEIHVMGPVAHRIRVLKDQFGEVIDNLEAKRDRLKAELAEANLMAAGFQEQNLQARAELATWGIRMDADGNSTVDMKVYHALRESKAVGQLRAALRRLEWSAYGGVDLTNCPACGWHKNNEKHAPDCWLAALLEGK